MVYGIFRDYNENLTIRKGEIVGQDGTRITVRFEDGKYWTYIETDIGKIVFYDENEAESAAEELSRRRRWS